MTRHYFTGKPLAAYLYLPRKSGARAARTVDVGRGVRVDLDEQGVPIGLEITAPAAVTGTELNAILTRHGVVPLDVAEWAPLAA